MRMTLPVKKLNFEPTIFRDWSIAYCELASFSAIYEFKKQFGWSYSNWVFLWDGKKETLYRAREEHINGMFYFIKNKISKNKNFIKEISQELLKDIGEYKKLLEKWLDLDLNKLNKNQVFLIFHQLKKEYIPLLPRFLIIMYFPQQIEQYYLYYKKVLKEENKICLATRSRVDKILAPLTEKFLRRMGDYILKDLRFKDFSRYDKFLTIKEIEIFLSGSYSKKWAIRLKRELQKRKKYFLLTNGKIIYSPFRNYFRSKGWKLIEYKVKEGVESIEGVSTYKSKKLILGKVKIVENKEELFKINQGDIIVAPMTTPEYASVFNKVSAIITDEGGVTCHAAIVSRELKKPCIIGTKIATHVLQDGQLVEVDANKGVVKIISLGPTRLNPPLKVRGVRGVMRRDNSDNVS